MAIPAFINALFFASKHWVWLCLTLGWLIIFFALYLFYLPARYRCLSFVVRDGCIRMTSGVFLPRIRSLPLQNVQFSMVMRGPLQRMFGLATLVVAAAGSSLALPGLRAEDAKALAEALLEPHDT